MTNSPRKRGRPATIDTDAAMQSIVELFRAKGFSAVSLDDLSDATGLSRPSLYRAFGDKLGMYMSALDAFGHQVMTEAIPMLRDELDLTTALTKFYDAMLEIYYRDDTVEPGCLVYGTAPSSAEIEAVKKRLRLSVEGLDDVMRAKLKLCAPDCDDDQIHIAAQIAANTLIAFSTRAKSGAAKKDLSSMGATTAQTVTRIVNRSDMNDV